MNKVFSVGQKLTAALVLVLFTGTLVAETNAPASYVKPDTDLSGYTRVKAAPLNLDNIEVLKPAWEQDDPDEWSFQPEDRTQIQQLFMDAMKTELETNGNYPVVSESGDDVLRIEVEILSITPYVKPGTQSSDSNYEISTLGSGDVVVSAELRDSSTRELLILVEGERTIGEEYKELSRENHIANVKSLFSKWGRKLRETLDQAHAE